MIRDFIRFILVEGRVEDTKKKYPQLSDEVISKLSQSDPWKQWNGCRP